MGALVSKRLMNQFKCISITERFIVIIICDILIFNVYLPKCFESGTYADSMLLLLAQIRNVINLNCGLKVVICGDFNFDFDGHHRGSILFKDLMSDFNLDVCDSMFKAKCAYTYRNFALITPLLIDLLFRQV
jgi:hypothetical protein